MDARQISGLVCIAVVITVIAGWLVWRQMQDESGRLYFVRRAFQRLKERRSAKGTDVEASKIVTGSSEGGPSGVASCGRVEQQAPEE